MIIDKEGYGPALSPASRRDLTWNGKWYRDLVQSAHNLNSRRIIQNEILTRIRLLACTWDLGELQLTKWYGSHNSVLSNDRQVMSWHGGLPTAELSVLKTCYIEVDSTHEDYRLSWRKEASSSHFSNNWTFWPFLNFFWALNHSEEKLWTYLENYPLRDWDFDNEICDECRFSHFHVQTHVPSLGKKSQVDSLTVAQKDA